MKHVIIADDHQVTRRGVRELVQEAFEGVVTEEASNGEELLARLDTARWDLIIVDVLMPGLGIVALLGRIREVCPETPILVLTGATELEYVGQVLRAGANGLIHKHQAADDLVEAIREVQSGGKYLHPQTAIEIANSIDDPIQPPLHHKLSPRELDIFRAIARGRTVKEIAAELELSSKTVSTYLSRIRDKIGLANHVEIARYALRYNLVD